MHVNIFETYGLSHTQKITQKKYKFFLSDAYNMWFYKHILFIVKIFLIEP